MKPLLLIVALATLIISCSALSHFSSKKKRKLKIGPLVLAVSFINLIFGSMTFLWAIGAVEYSQDLMLVLLSFLIIVQTTSLILTLSKIQKNKKIAYPLFLLLIAIIPFILNQDYFHIVIPLSFLITIMTFLTYTEDHESHISMLIAYASVSLILYVLAFVNQSLIFLFLTISSSLFLVFYMEFLKFLKKPHAITTSTKNISPIIPFLKHLIFIIIITNFVFVGTVSVHELGHIVSVKSSNCTDAQIIYDLETFPHTEVSCEDVSQNNKWILAGILLPFIIASLLIFGGGTSIKEIGLEIIGFNIAISYMDMQALGLSKNLSLIFMGAGISLAALGLALLANSRTNHF